VVSPSSRLIIGKRITSLILVLPVRNITSLSIPTPRRPVGGMTQRSASTNSVVGVNLGISSQSLLHLDLEQILLKEGVIELRVGVGHLHPARVMPS